MEPPDSEYCYLRPAIRMQLVESWLLGMLPCESCVQGRTLPILLTVENAANILMLVAVKGWRKACGIVGPELTCM